jgi:mono/diheme cytochrome c family protein
MHQLRSVSLIASMPLVAILTVGCAASGGAAGGAPAAVTVTPEMIAEGRTLYTNPGRCNVCHGPTGLGGRVGPNLADSNWLWVDPAQDLHTQLFNVIKQGVPQPREAQTPMPAMGGAQLTDAQIHAIAAYVASL